MTAHISPRWPALMTRKTAVEYLDVSEAAFEREIAAGRIPDGVMFGSKPHWRKDALDKALAMIAGEVTPSYMARFEERHRGKAA
jgi:LPS sulfotransferase NodH